MTKETTSPFAQRGIKGVIYGPPGIGKTSLIRTLPAESTLVLDLEAGLLSVADLTIPSRQVRRWEEARAYASIIGGVNPNADPGKPYGEQHVAKCLEHYGKGLDPAVYSTLFVDSITVASRLCLDWVKRQPDAYTKQGEFNGLRAYGMLAEEMLAWFTQLQHAPGKNVWFVGLLDKDKNDLGQPVWEPQLEGGKTKHKLAGIVDVIATMTEIRQPKGDGTDVAFRAFVTATVNRWGYPAKDRSGTLSPIEPPHLGRLMDKIAAGKVINVFNYDLPVELDQINF